MGVSGLLGSLKSIQKVSHLRDFAGKTVAVDAYGWLHRGSVACAIDLVTGKPTRKYVDFAMHRVRMLQHFGLTPYIVFDGDRLPSKAATETARQARRAESKTRGLEMLSHGRTTEAHRELQKAVDVTPEMARRFIDELRRLNVSYVVAPYEADSQMVYLERQGLVDGIVSEDSDLLVFGARCLITKLDQWGECVVINRSQFTACREINLTNWTDSEFRCMAILSGCDYLEGLPQMGIKTAHRYVRKYKTIDRIIRGVQFERKTKVPADYLENYQQANKTFLHQWVFCPERRGLVHFTPLDTDVDPNTLAFIGTRIDDEISQQVALGNLDPISKTVLTSPQISSTTSTSRPAFANRSISHPFASENESVKKSSKIMESFVTKRQPLAELDPNTMQHTDSQRRLLRTAEHQRPWSAATAPLSRIVTGSSRANTAPRPLAPISTPSAGAREPKRRRLCMDELSSPSKSDKLTEESPFFGNSSSKLPILASPTLPKVRQRKRDKSFELWSDDSIEGAMRELKPQTQSRAIDTATKVKKLAVFNDEDSESRTAVEPTRHESQHTNPSLSSTTTTTTTTQTETQPSANTSITTASFDTQPPSLIKESPPTKQNLPAPSQVDATPAKPPQTKPPLLQHFAFKGSEDALVPESDIESPSAPAESSDISEPNTPTAPSKEQPARGDAAHKRRHILDLEQFMYAGQPFLGLGAGAH